MNKTDSIISRFPSFYQADEYNVLRRYIEVFASLLNEADDDLRKVLRSHWVNTADNEDSQGFDSNQKGDLDKIFSLYLESLGGTSLLKQTGRREGIAGEEDDRTYRNRIQGLIQVLLNGASTKEGIRDIVAANLGILGDEKYSLDAKNRIRIEEYLPQPFIRIYEAVLFSPFEVFNPNLISQQPEIIIKIKDSFAANSALINPRLTNLDTNQSILYEGTISPKDIVRILQDTTLLVNGIKRPYTGDVPEVPSGTSKWRFDADVGLAAGIFNQSLFDFSLFDQSDLRTVARFDYASFAGEDTSSGAVFASLEPVADISVNISTLKPASFGLRIPWDIPGFTTKIEITDNTLEILSTKSIPIGIIEQLETIKGQEFGLDWFSKLEALIGTEAVEDYLEIILRYVKFTDLFANLDVNPRNQIKYIVDKVKAAGVLSEVRYEKQIREEHESQTSFHMTGERLPFEVDHEIPEADPENPEIIGPSFNITGTRHSAATLHEMEEHFSLSGTFDFTRFDSLNTFA